MGKELAQTWHDFVRIWKIPKKPYDIRMWASVHRKMWTAVCLVILWFVLGRIIELVKVLQ